MPHLKKTLKYDKSSADITLEATAPPEDGP